jgi:lipopolysaccharide transport system permease protein
MSTTIAIETSIPPNSPAHALSNEPEYELVIKPRPGWISVDWKELWQFRELLYFQVWRDVKVRYKQSVLGIAWALLVPIFNMLIFTLIFGNFADMKNKLPQGMSYPIYVYCGILPWTFFSTALTLGGLALVSQQAMITKIYFPRLFVPASVVGGALVDMALSFLVMFSLMAWYGVAPTWDMIGLLPMMLLLILCSLGIAFSLSAVTVAYRDFRFVIPFMAQAWMFLSPVFVPDSIVPQRFKWLAALNPMVGVIEGFRSSLLHRYQPWQPLGLAISTLSCVFLFVFGLYYFRKTERRIADIA